MTEAAEILRRVVLAARGSEAIPIHVAIHEARINRHAHVLFALRPVDSDGTLGLKLRDFILLHRHTASGNKGADVVEAINWPYLSWETQQAFFHELEWIVTTTLANRSPVAEKTEFAQILAIDPVNEFVDVIRSGERKQIDLKRVLGVRPAAALSIREARGLFGEATVAVEATDPRRL